MGIGIQILITNYLFILYQEIVKNHIGGNVVHLITCLAVVDNVECSSDVTCTSILSEKEKLLHDVLIAVNLQSSSGEVKLFMHE